MTDFNFGAMASELDSVQEEGVTFEDKSLKWNTAEDVKDVVNALNNKKIVHYLKLEGNTLGIDAAAAIGRALQRHPEFHKAFWRNLFTGRIKSEIPVALKHLGNGLMTAKAQLTVLDLSDNALGPNGMEGLKDLLRSPTCYSLQELHLNNCGLGIGGGQMLSQALLDCHKASTEAGTPLQLKVFITGRNRLENEGAQFIANIFARLKTLEVISMPQNSIYYAGITALAQSFAQCPNLRVLNLNDNTVTEKGAAALVEFLEGTENLRDINFGDCLLKTNGAYHFANLLEVHHPNLEVADFSFNEFDLDAGLALASCLAKKGKLRELNLNGNHFGKNGCDILRDEWNAKCVNPSALGDFPDDSEDEDDDEEDEDEENSVEGEDDGEGEDDEEGEDYVEIDEDGVAFDIDTTEEVNDSDVYYGQDESAYLTAANTKLFGETTISNKSVTFTELSSKTTATAENFCLSQSPCTLEMFESLTDQDKLVAFNKIIDQFTDDNHLLLLVFTTLKCAHLSKSSKDALKLAIDLYKQTFDYAKKTKQERRVLTYLLKQLGLLRSEDESFKSAYDLKSCRYALRETFNKQEISSEYVTTTLNMFLEKLDD